MAKPRPRTPRPSLDGAVSWYHGKLNREAADHILGTHGNQEGQFLVRESTTSPKDFVLSVCHDGEPTHYQIRRFGEDAFFSIDEGPIFHGIEALISYYQEDGTRGLSTQLNAMCVGQPPPPEIRCHGCCNLLHRATKEGNTVIAGELLRSGYHSLDAKNQEGQTAVHLACLSASNLILDLLLESGASANIRDSSGLTPLHYACRENNCESVKLLMQKGSANPQVRASEGGWVPLHQAAVLGHLEPIKVLLEFGAPRHPRCDHGKTPLELAVAGSHVECIQFIKRHKPATPKMAKSFWFHDTTDRERAKALLEHHGMVEGLFLVRKSSRINGSFVLSMAYASRIYNFEIQKKEDNYYIDDGPYLESLEHVIDYYSRFTDGLPMHLVKPVVPTSNHLFHASAKLNRKAVMSEIYVGPNVICKESLELDLPIGEGEYGSVLKGAWMGPGNIKMAVAVKKLHDEQVQKSRDEFIREVEVMAMLRHPCIVHLVGVCLGPPLMMVQELVPLGSMLDFLLDYPDEIDPLLDLKLWAAQIASGMMFLESKRFVHRDLAARNILLASKKQVKITDFGLSRVLGLDREYYKATSGGRWPVKWYAPESINFGSFSHASDVWSYGVTLWEMFSLGDQPYGEMNGTQVLEMIESGKRLLCPPECPVDVYTVMIKCWLNKPNQRPTFSELHHTFAPQTSQAAFRCSLVENDQD